MRDLDHALRLIEATVQSVKVPVTLKMRLGWDDNSINAPELAKRAEDAGIQAITVHGRTRCQFYKGFANWQKVQWVREHTNLPLTVNGDIRDLKAATKAIVESGADMVMIGRAAYGQPWLPGVVAGKLSAEEAARISTSPLTVIAHHEEMLSFYGIENGIRKARKHLGWYLDRLNLPDVLKRRRHHIMTSFDVKEIHQQLSDLYEIFLESDQLTSQRAA